MENKPRVFLKHCRELNYCSHGIREFCKKHHIDFITFIREGIDCDELEKINDMHTRILVKKAKEEFNHGQQ